MRSNEITADGHPQRWKVLSIMCLCLILVVASVSSLNVAIPSIVTAIDPSQTQVLWILDAYALVFAGLLLPAGALGDRYGRKGALMVGLVIFGLAAIAASTMGTATPLIAMRALMGVGAAFIMPATLSIITAVFPPHERAKAIAVWAGFAGAGGALGSIASGLLLKAFWWGSVFFVNVPIVVLAVVLIALLVPTSRQHERRPLDVVGAVLSMVGFSSLVFGIIQGPEEGWTHPTTVLAFVAAVVLLGGWLVWELRRPFPMLDPRLFRIPRFGLGALTVTSAFLTMFGMFYLSTYYFQFVRGDTPLSAAVRILPFPLIMIAIAPRSPALAARVGARRLLPIGLGVQVVGFSVMAFLRPGSPYLVVVVGMGLLAAGQALIMPTCTHAIVSSLPQDKAGVGSAVNDTTREVGGAIGIALMGSIVSVGYRNGIGSVTEGLPAQVAGAARDSLGSLLRVASRLGSNGPVIIERAKEAHVDGQRWAFIGAAIISVVTGVVVARGWPAEVPLDDARAPSGGRSPGQEADDETVAHVGHPVPTTT